MAMERLKIEFGTSEQPINMQGFEGTLSHYHFDYSSPPLRFTFPSNFSAILLILDARAYNGGLLLRRGMLEKVSGPYVANFCGHGLIFKAGEILLASISFLLRTLPASDLRPHRDQFGARLGVRRLLLCTRLRLRCRDGPLSL